MTSLKEEEKTVKDRHFGKIAVLAVAMVMVLSCIGSVSFAKAPLKVAMVVAGGLGDRSFYDSGHAGLVRAQKELGVVTKVLECKDDPSLYYDQLLAAAQNYDLVFIVPGYQMDKEIQELAPQFPNVTFVYIDGTIDVPGVVSVDYAEHEGSFLAGALAAMMTTRSGIKGIDPKTKVIGMVGGMDIPVIRNFLAGYKQGAAAVDPSVKVEVLYAGTFSDPAKGKELTFALHDKGADIVYQVAGKTGEGVLFASKEAGHYAIGVDSDQCYVVPDNIVGSMMKRVDNSVYQTIKYAVEGTLKKGTVYHYGIKENGVGLCFCETMQKVVPKDVIEKLRSLEEQIRSGKIKVQEAS